MHQYVVRGLARGTLYQGPSLETALATLARDIRVCRIEHGGPTDARLYVDGTLVETELQADMTVTVAPERVQAPRPPSSEETGIIRTVKVDGLEIDFRLNALTAEGAAQARVTLTDLARLLGYQDKAQLKRLAERHERELAEFGLTVMVTVYVPCGLNQTRAVQEPTYNQDQCIILGPLYENRQTTPDVKSRRLRHAGLVDSVSRPGRVCRVSLWTTKAALDAGRYWQPWSPVLALLRSSMPMRSVRSLSTMDLERSQSGRLCLPMLSFESERSMKLKH